MRKIDKALFARIVRGLPRDGFKFGDLDRQIPLERTGDLPHLVGDAADFLGDDRKAASRLARAMRFNQRIERENTRAMRHPLDLFDLPIGQLADLRLRDEVSDIGIRVLARRGRRTCCS